jgi:hypothetical protein
MNRAIPSTVGIFVFTLVSMIGSAVAPAQARCKAVYALEGDQIRLKFEDDLSGAQAKQAGLKLLSPRVSHSSSKGVLTVFPEGSEVPVTVEAEGPGAFGRGGWLKFSVDSIAVQCEDRKPHYVPVSVIQPPGGLVKGSNSFVLFRIIPFLHGGDAVFPKAGELTLKIKRTVNVAVKGEE